MALTASAGSGEDYERARLVVNAAQRIKDLGARKAYLDRIAARFFTHATTGQKRLDHERRVTGIAAAIIAGDGATAGRLLGEIQGNFQRWWETFAAVIDTLAEAGKPDLAIANAKTSSGHVTWMRSAAAPYESGTIVNLAMHCALRLRSRPLPWFWRCQSKAAA